MIRLLLLCWACLGAAGAVSPHDSTSLCDLRACQCHQGAKIQCNCDLNIQEIVLQSHGAGYLPKTFGSIAITNCLHVRIASRSMYDIKALRKVTLTNIANLELEREAFLWNTTKILDAYQEPGLDIFITNSSIPEIKPEVFKGHLNSIYLKNVHVGSVAPLAIANTAVMDRIEIINTNISHFSPKSLNKLILESIIVEGGFMGMIPSNAWNSVEVRGNLRFEGVNFNTIRSSAFRITEPKSFKLLSCTINLLEGEGFVISTKGDIFINDNIFDNIHQGAFLGIHRDLREALPGNIVLENNTLTKFDDGALAFNTSNLKMNLDRININQQCECEGIKRWSRKLVQLIKYPKYYPTDSYAQYMWCNKGKIETVVAEYEMKHCTKHHSKIPIILASLIGILVFLICICFVGFWIYRKHVKQYMNVPTRESKRISTNSNHIIVIPESKIYRETELNIITESVQPITEYITPQQAVNS